MAAASAARTAVRGGFAGAEHSQLPIIHDSLIFPNFNKKAGFFTASRKRFFSRTKPLILQAKTAVKPNNVKYVFLTGLLKNRVFHSRGIHRFLAASS